VVYWTRGRLARKQGGLSIDSVCRIEVVEEAGFYPSVQARRGQFRFALQHKNSARELKIITGELFELY
jgi:hypothetical protein